MLLQKFLNVYISLLVIANPLAVSTVFVALMSQCKPPEIKATAYKASGVAFGVLLFFALFGESVLTGLGIRLPSFHIAGGLLLFVVAFRMLFGDPRSVILQGEPNSFADRADVAVFPLAIPLIAGPGCMTAMILLMSRANTGVEQATVFLALVAVIVTILACLLASRTLLRVLGTSGSLVISRVMGVLLAARSVQFVVDGIRDVNKLFFT